MAHSATFWDRVAAKYFKQPIADEAAYQEKLRRTRTYLNEDSTVFEFGCGTGGTAIAHAPYVSHVLATDISPKMLEIARRQAADEGVRNVVFECADIAEYPSPAKPFDAVLGMSILHLVEDLDAVISKVSAMLAPGGVFVSSTACLGDRMAWFKLIAPIGRALGRFPYVKVMKADDLVASLEANGFEIEERWRPNDGKAHAVFIIARKSGDAPA